MISCLRAKSGSLTRQRRRNQMALMTKEQKERYLREDSACCPFCGSANIEADVLDLDAGGALQRLDCLGCGESWRDEYHLHDVFTYEDAVAEQDHGGPKMLLPYTVVGAWEDQQSFVQ